MFYILDRVVAGEAATGLVILHFMCRISRLRSRKLKTKNKKPPILMATHALVRKVVPGGSCDANLALYLRDVFPKN